MLFRSAFGDVQYFGNLPVFHFLQIAQNHRFPQIGGELLQGRLQDLAGLAPGQCLVRADRGRPAHLFQHRKLLLNGIRDALLAGTAIVVNQEITRHPGQPGMKAAFRAAEGLDGLENPQEHLLRQILRFLHAVGKTEAEAVYLPRVLPDEILPGGFIAVQTSRNERLVQAIEQLSASGNFHYPAGSLTARGISSKMFPS